MLTDEIRAACLTENELAAQITTLYLEYKKAPNVEVFVTEFQSRPVAVIGAVNAPGQFRLQRQVRLLELLTFSGGPATRAGRIVNVIHTEDRNMCGQNDPAVPSVATAGEQLVVYKLTDTLKGLEEANPFVRAGDIISLPDADQVFVIGQVLSPQAIALRDKPITISRAIAMSGGPSRDGKTSRIRIVRQIGEGDSKQEIYVDLQAVLKQKAEDIRLLPNDIVEVPSSTGKTILHALTGAIAPTLSQVPVRMIP
jgi:polysaccharide export outer membrane protein